MFDYYLDIKIEIKRICFFLNIDIHLKTLLETRLFMFIYYYFSIKNISSLLYFIFLS
jgi:hypothetical protein